MSKSEDDIYHCPACGYIWSGYERPPPHPHCPQCHDDVMRRGPPKDRGNSGPEESILRQAYDQLDYGFVEVSEQVTVPSVSPAKFDYDESPDITDAYKIEQGMDGSELSCIDVLAKNGQAWYEFSYTAKVFDDDQNEFCNLNISTAGVTVFQREDSLSFETFERVVRLVENVLETSLVYNPETDNE